MANIIYTTICNTTINNNTISTTRNINDISDKKRRKCRCIACNRFVNPDEGIRVTTPHHPLGLTLCDTHASLYTLDSYSSENHEYVGTPTNKGVTTSIELETVNNTVLSKASMLFDLGFTATNDSSLGYNGIEYKSRVHNSLQAMTKTLGTIESLMNDFDAFDTRHESCGAHIHTGLYNNRLDFRHIIPDMDTYFAVFGDLYEYLDKMPNAKMKEYFGRGFVGYARTCRKDGDRYVLPKHNGNGKRDRYNNEYLNGNDNVYGTGSWDCTQHKLAFNLQHSYSLEFRLPKFINAVQYRACICAMQEVVVRLVTAYDNGDVTKCSKSLVKVFKRYFPY